MPEAKTQRGTNTIVADELRGYIHRIERIEEMRSQSADDIRAVYAEAKAHGYTPKYIRKVIKARKQTPSDRDDERAMMDLYETAAGLRDELPLFRAVGAMSVDLTARESVVEALKQLVPLAGEIVVRVGGVAVRLWGDEAGNPQAEDVVDRPASAPSAAGNTGSATPKPKVDVPDCDDAGAEELGREAFRNDQPIISNPFPWDDPRRALWDVGWRKESGGDGMGPDD